MKRAPGLLLLSVSLFGHAACRDSLDGPPLDVPSCKGAWERVTAPEPYDIVHNLLYREGTLYYSSFDQHAILAQPVTGGVATSLAEDRPAVMSLDGDRLIYRAGQYEEKFVAVPVDGGPKELLVDLSTLEPKPGVSLWNAVTATDFYWTEDAPGGAGTSAWKLPREGGTPTLLGTAFPATPDSFKFSEAGIAADGVILSDRLTSAVLIPSDGGPVRPLASPKTNDRPTPQLAGIEPAGAYWLRARVDDVDRFDLDLSPADGGPLRPFWHEIPPHAGVKSVWPDGKGGWILVGGELASDGQYHTVVWAYAGHDTARLLACSPGTSLEATVPANENVVVAPDAVYLISTNLPAETWEINRIALPSP